MPGVRIKASTAPADARQGRVLLPRRTPRQARASVAVTAMRIAVAATTEVTALTHVSTAEMIAAASRV